jgi:1,4-dihydroxy-2-naphthoyl-CoA hydrolase
MAAEKAGFDADLAGLLPDVFGIEWEEVARGLAVARITVARRHMAPNGFLHAASVIALADSCTGFGCQASLPEGGISFTTVELKANYFSSAKEGDVVGCRATMKHGGRTTQVWDADVVNETAGKAMAVFRCTQMILYPR